jgi:NADH dehydrogenase [ubiquinone] 1 alpha subcomplex assembly factor 7
MMGLNKILTDKITTKGYIDLFEFMKESLTHPKFGFYMKKKIFGVNGSFVTSPEISQMFGELIGAWCLDIWTKMNKPNNFQVIEMGPGLGTLMKDLLRTCNKLNSDFLKSVKVTLIEKSPRLKDCQMKTLNRFNISWHTSFSEKVINGPFVMIANEFLDTLPIRQFQFSKDSWNEKVISFSKIESKFFFKLKKIKNLPYILRSLRIAQKAKEGDIIEFNPGACNFVSKIGRIMKKDPGYALIIDYGHTKISFGETLQAVRKHKFCNALENPGESDLTAHVDFELMSKIAKLSGAKTYRAIPQGQFLENLGIRERAKALKEIASPDEKVEIDGSLARLTQKKGMGELFKVLVLSSDQLPEPDGLTINS